LDASGKPDVVSLVNGQMEGPVVARGSGWQSSLGFTPSKVYRNGSAASLANIQDYDVVYWNASMGTVWAYAKKATGAIQAIAPDRDTFAGALRGQSQLRHGGGADLRR
jgi:hypothetical protein